jgi:molecular chaperone DnaK (HSP70)
MPPVYSIGIDLGTTNSVLACAAVKGEEASVEVIPIPQLTAAGTLEQRSMLPSFLYVGTSEEVEKGAFSLPWANPPYGVGEWARRRGAEVPMRVVSGAKSWLAYGRVDRREAILPWNAPPEVARLSPVEASRRCLEHIIAAWEHKHPEAPLKEQQVVLTVPASFDAVARELTREAALAAGIAESFLLLEEPQAAFYAWLADQEQTWRKVVREGDVIVVCDVGGGTTDLTLIGVTQEGGELVLNRLAVGNHILVGGDNMDLALAHLAQDRFAARGVAFDAWQSVALWHACRTAKETLLAPDGPEACPVTILGRGRKVVGGTISVELTRAEVAEVLASGFFPAAALDARPARRAMSGFRELGLPFEADPAITRHLAHFLNQQGGARPTRVLFNGGVFRSEFFRRQILAALGEWFGGGPASLTIENNSDFDLAVARGAAYYGRAKLRRGIRIRGGAPRSYYVGIETAGPAIPGAPRPLRALCVVPRDMEEGTELDVPGDEIGLVTGEQAHFRFFSSLTRRDLPGTLLSGWTDDELLETSSLTATLPAAGTEAGDYVAVRFHVRLTELGVLELWCASTGSNDRWKLEFNVREPETG